MILAIESTCDETAAAVVDDRRVLSSVVASQAELHAVYRGVVPELASRAHLDAILPVLREAMMRAGVTENDLDAVAVAHRPGLIGSLLIGVTAAKTLAWAWGKPLVAVDHVHAHLFSVGLDDKPDPLLPAVGLVASGGHTSLYLVRDWLDITRLGGTIDDAIGEAYDKVAAILGLGYPGGPILDKLATRGDATAVKFPRPLLGRESLDFSFSGLKTAVLYHVRGHAGRERDASSLNEQQIADTAASFQAACVDVVIEKLRRAIAQTNAKSVILGGGVSANRGLREALARLPVPSHVPPLEYCTDNAAMIGGLGGVLLAAGRVAELSLDASPFSVAGTT
jgi:N6-L-threonylcarbamoyladenine synthase